MYVKSLSTDEFEYCLSVKMGVNTESYYIALAAMTGQVADKHDVYALNLRYLDSADKNSIDDRNLRRAGYSGRRVSIKSVLFWLLIFLLNTFLCYELAYEWWQFDKMRNESLSPVMVCQRLNGHIWVANIVHVVVFVLVIMAGNRLLYLGVNAPFIGWRGYQYMTHNVKLEAVKLRKHRNMFDVGMPVGSLTKFAILLLSFFMSIYNVFTS